MSSAAVERLQKLAAREESGLVQVYLASAMQRLDYEQRWPIAEALSAKRRVRRTIANCRSCSGTASSRPSCTSQTGRSISPSPAAFPLLRQHTARRLTVEIERLPEAVNALVARLAEIDDSGRAARSSHRNERGPARLAQSAGPSGLGRRRRQNWPQRECRRPDADPRPGGRLRRRPGARRTAADRGRRQRRARSPPAGAADARRRRRDDLPALLAQAGRRPDARSAKRFAGWRSSIIPRRPRLILDNYGRLDPEGRAIAVNTLVSRPAYARALLEAVAAGRISRGDISAFHARQIRSFDDEALTAQLTNVWGETRVTDADKRKLIERYKTLLTADQIAGGNLRGRPRALQQDVRQLPRAVRPGKSGRTRPDRFESPEPRLPARKHHRPQRLGRRRFPDDGRRDEERPGRDRTDRRKDRKDADVAVAIRRPGRRRARRHRRDEAHRSRR